VTLEGLVHEVLTDGPGHRGKGERKKQGSRQYARICGGTSIMERIMEKIDPYAGKRQGKRQAQVCPSSHGD
jgi:hypothetical protein